MKEKNIEQLALELQNALQALADSNKESADAAAENKLLEDENKSLKEALDDSTKESADAAAENEMLQDENESLKEANESMKKEIERLLNTPDKEESKSGVGEKFEYDGEKYKVLTSAIRIPNIGRRTALEILTDEKAQEWLVKNKSGAISKVE